MLAFRIGHVGMMGVYGLIHTAVAQVTIPIVDKLNEPRARFEWCRRFEAWKFGSGKDYQLPEEN
jgi:hypothetical protein